MNFPCTNCGSCCKRVGQVVESLNYMGITPDNELYFPYSFNEKGWCEKLTPDNKCSIYETRPLICNIEKLFPLTELTETQYIALNISACNKMMDHDGLSAEFRISI